MRIDCPKAWAWVFSVVMFSLCSPMLAQAQSGNRIISIRTLADQQRQREEAEFLAKLSGQNEVPASASEGVKSTETPAVQKSPEKKHIGNVLLSVYGSNGNLIAEFSAPNDEVQVVRAGDTLMGYQVQSISNDGVVLSKRGAQARTIPVGGRF